MAINKRSFIARLTLILVLAVLVLVLFWALQSGRLGFQAQIASYVTVNAPNGGECFVPGASTTITWTKNATDHVDIYFRPSGVQSGQVLIASTNYGTSQGWSVPHITTTLARIYIEAHSEPPSDPWEPPDRPIGGAFGALRVLAHNTVLGSDVSDNSFIISGECNPPAISNVTHTSVTTNSATITWATNQNATSYVDYGLTTSYGSSAGSGNLVRNHSVTLSGLAAGTTYHYRVRSVNSIGRQSLSSNRTLTTAGNPPAPTVSVSLAANPTSGRAPLNGVDLTASVSGTATGDIRYRIDCRSDGSYERDIIASANPYTAVDLCSYGAAGSYTARAQVDRGGVSAVSTTVINVTSGSVTTPPTTRPPTGTTPPTTRVTTPTRTGDTAAPAIVDILAMPSSISAVITWSTNEPASSFVDFGMTADYGTTAGQDELVTAHTVTLLDLIPGTIYHYRIYSKDAAGNGARSEGATFSTLAEGSLTLPVITDMLVNGVSSFGIGGSTPGSETVKLKVGDILTIKGTALANASISVFVLSEEQLFQTTSDEQGIWTIDIPTTDLVPGEHSIEVTTLASDGQVTPRLFLASFIVAAAGQPVAESGGRWFWYIVAGIIAVLAFGAVFFYRKIFGSASESAFSPPVDSEILPPILTSESQPPNQSPHLQSSNFVPEQPPDEEPPPSMTRLT